MDMQEARVGRVKIIRGGDCTRMVIPGTKNILSKSLLFRLFLFLLVGAVPGILEIIRQPGGLSRIGPVLIRYSEYCLLFGGLIFLILPWLVFAKEIITISQGTLKIEKGIFGRSTCEEYFLKEAKNFRVVASEAPNDSGPHSREMSGTMIAFDYGADRIRFGYGLDEFSAGIVLEEMKQYLPKSW